MEGLNVSEGFKLFTERLNHYLCMPYLEDIELRGNMEGRILDMTFEFHSMSSPFIYVGAKSSSTPAPHKIISNIEFLFIRDVVRNIVENNYPRIKEQPYSQADLLAFINVMISSVTKKINENLYVTGTDNNNRKTLIIVRLTQSEILLYRHADIIIIPITDGIYEGIHGCLDVLGGD